MLPEAGPAPIAIQLAPPVVVWRILPSSSPARIVLRLDGSKAMAVMSLDGSGRLPAALPRRPAVATHAHPLAAAAEQRERVDGIDRDGRAVRRCRGLDQFPSSSAIAAAHGSMDRRLVYDAGIRWRDERRQSVVEIELTPQHTAVRGLEQAVSAHGKESVRRRRNGDELAPVIGRQPAVCGRPSCAAIGRAEHAAVLKRSKDDRRRPGRDGGEARDSAAIGTSPRNVLEHRRITGAGCRRRSRRNPGSCGRAEAGGAEHDHQREGSRGDGGSAQVPHESSVRPKCEYPPVTKSSAYQS